MVSVAVLNCLRIIDKVNITLKNFVLVLAYFSFEPETEPEQLLKTPMVSHQ